jgi:putative ubiquitin-RnfH superfamily antitoxin RatB of RatAB toxin-antitoxin module
MENADKMEVEVAYARPDQQVILSVTLPIDATIEDAIRHSGVLEQFPEIDLAENKVGVFGKLVKLNSSLQPGDRVEIYRSLIADPKEVRRQRAAEGKRMKKGGGSLGGAGESEAAEISD